MIVLDTNVIRELTKPKPNSAVMAWAECQPAETIYATSIGEAELLYGIAILPPGRRREALHRAVGSVFQNLLVGRVLPFDRLAAVAYAEWAVDRRQAGKPVATADLQIAAIARAHGATGIATRNTRDFDGCGVLLIDPWQIP